MTPSYSREHRVESKRLPIPMYLGNITLQAFLALFRSRVLTPDIEDASTHSQEILIAAKKSRRELSLEFGKQIVDQSRCVILDKAVQRDYMIESSQQYDRKRKQ